jgi:uncharacterized membrane protein (UPF0127 family)
MAPSAPGRSGHGLAIRSASGDARHRFLRRARIGGVHRTTPRHRAATFVAGLSLLAAACGGGDDESSADSPADGAGSDADADASATTGVEPQQPGDAVLVSAGGAPAAEGAGLDEPPGPVDRVPLDGFGEVAIAITNPDGSVKGWCVLLAERDEQRQQGLMEVTDLGGYEGMLFVWNEDSASSFYMRNTPTPLSIAWVDAEGALVSTADMEPCADVETCPLYGSEGSYRFALEVPKGKLDSIGLVDGATMRVGGSCAA